MGRAVRGIKKTLNAIGEDISAGGSRIELLSDSQVTVEGCKGIMDYGDEYIKLNIGNGTVAIIGAGMYACSYCGDTVIVRGKITSLELCR